MSKTDKVEIDSSQAAPKKPWVQPSATTYAASNASSQGRVSSSDGVVTCHS